MDRYDIGWEYEYIRSLILDMFSIANQFSAPIPDNARVSIIGNGGIEMNDKLKVDRRLGDNLRAMRLRRHLTRPKLCIMLQCRGCDINAPTYTKYEYGQLNIRVSVLIHLQQLYGCSFDDFFTGLGAEDIP